MRGNASNGSMAQAATLTRIEVGELSAVNQLEELKERLASLLQKAGELDPSAIPDTKKKIPVWKLEGAPVRIKNVIGNTLGVDTIWDLVHVPHGKFLQYRCFTNSRSRMSELVSAIDEAILTLAGDTIASN